MGLKARLGAMILYVTDLKRSLEFYRDVLGMKVSLFTDPFQYGLADAGSVEIMFFKRKEEHPGQKNPSRLAAITIRAQASASESAS